MSLVQLSIPSTGCYNINTKKGLINMKRDNLNRDIVLGRKCNFRTLILNILLIGMFAFLPNIFAAETFQVLSPMPTAPTINGKCEASEWRGAAAGYALISEQTQLKCSRDISFYLGYDQKYFYFAQMSVAPNAPQQLDNKDIFELTFISPAMKKICFRFNFDGEGTLPSGAKYAGIIAPGPQWTSEVAIPWSALGLVQAPDQAEWKFQICRYWQNLPEKSFWHLPQTGESFGKLRFDRNALVAGSLTILKEVSACTKFELFNPTNRPVRINVHAMIKSIEVPHYFNQKITVPAGKTLKPGNYFMVGPALNRNLDVKITDADSGKIYYARNFDWNVSQGVGFYDPDPPLMMEFALNPSRNRIIARLRCNKKEKMSKIKEVNFQIIDNHGILIQEVPSEKKDVAYYFKMWEYPKLKLGDFNIVAILKWSNGETTKLKKSFEIRNFEWENTAVGTERIVPPPFTPLRLDRDKGEIHALQTGYKFGGVFWDAIYAQNENLLAAPVALYANGKRFNLESRKLLEASSDRIIYASQSSAGTLKLDVRYEYEFDGMCKTTLEFNPGPGIKLNSLYLNIPLKKEWAKLYHHTGFGVRSNPSEWIPLGKDKVWEYVCKNQFSYIDYIWFGELYKGICWFSNSLPPLIMTTLPTRTHEIIRDGQTVTLRIHLLSSPALVKEKFKYTMGFEPTPVKPRPEGFRRYMSGTITQKFPNTTYWNCITWYKHFFAYATRGQAYVPHNNDYSWLEYVLNSKVEPRDKVMLKAQALMDKNHITDADWEKLYDDGGEDRGTLSSRLCDFASFVQMADSVGLYLNPRAGFRCWKESKMYDGEWMDCAFSPPDDSFYHRVPVQSYTDMLLYQARSCLRRFPKIAYLYYDCLYPSGSLSPFRGSRELSIGNYSCVKDIFELRELAKRTMILLTQEKRMVPTDPRYVFMIAHMTDANIIPVIGLFSHNLGWEMKYGQQDFQDRFPEPFHLVQSLGTQSGTVPCEIISTTSGDTREWQHRTLFAVSFAFDIMNFFDPGSMEQTPFYNKVNWLVRNFGYGLDDVAYYPGYEPGKNPVKSSVEHVRITTIKRHDGKAMLLIGNLGVATRVGFDLTGLGYKRYVVKNAETSKEIAKDQNPSIDIRRHDYAILEITEIK